MDSSSWTVFSFLAVSDSLSSQSHLVNLHLSVFLIRKIVDGMACAYLHSEIKMVSDSRNALRTMAFRIKYFLANHSVIHTVSYKLVHEFVNNHYECDLGNVIWKKTRLGFGTQTKIRIASGIKFSTNPPPPTSFHDPLLIGEDVLEGGDTPPLRDRFPNLISHFRWKHTFSIWEQ